MISARGKYCAACCAKRIIRTAPSEKNQNSSAAHSRSVTVARAKTVKNVCVTIAHNGSKKIAMTNFTQRVGTMSGLAAGGRRVVGTT